MAGDHDFFPVSEADAMHWRPKTKLMGDIQRSRRLVRKIEAQRKTTAVGWRPQERVVLDNAARAYMTALQAHLALVAKRSTNVGFRGVLHQTLSHLTTQAGARLSHLIRTAPARVPETAALADLQSLDDFIVACFRTAAYNLGVSPATADEYALHLKMQLLNPALTTAQRLLIATFTLLLAKVQDRRRNGTGTGVKEAQFEFQPMGVAA